MIVSTQKICVRVYHSPCGELVLGACGDTLCLCDWAGAGRRRRETWGAVVEDGASALLDEASAQLDEYFAGTRQKFTLPLQFCGSEFQMRVWQELLAIPYGHTISYGELARRLGRPSAVRAVANAAGANVLSLFAPCHRVIGGNQALTGYRGGLVAKRYLLQLESASLFRKETWS